MLDLKLKGMILNFSLGLILSSSLAWLRNQAKFKLLYFITSLILNIIFKLVSSLNQAWTFYICCRAEFEHSLLDKARLIYSPRLTNLLRSPIKGDEKHGLPGVLSGNQLLGCCKLYRSHYDRRNFPQNCEHLRDQQHEHCHLRCRDG